MDLLDVNVADACGRLYLYAAIGTDRMVDLGDLVCAGQIRIITASSTTRLFITGSMPGMPEQAGHTQSFGVFAAAWPPQEQNILDSVFNSTCVSSPITTS